MKNIKTIKMIMNLKTLTRAEKKKFIAKGIAEIFLNSYKFILKLPILIIACTFVIIGTIFEKIGEVVDLIFCVFDGVVDKIDNLKVINLCSKEEIEYLTKAIKEEHTYKIESKDIKQEVNIGRYEEVKAFSDAERTRAKSNK